MGEVGEITAEAATTEFGKPKSDRLDNEPQNMTFDEFEAKAWQESEQTLTGWKGRLESFVGRRANIISQLEKNTFSLYGKPPPERPIAISLHYFPEHDREKGEPTKQLTEKRGIDKNMGDVLCWVSEATVLPTDTQKDFDNRTAETISRILHETQHALLQDSQFGSLIAQAENDPRVTQAMNKLSSSQEHYIEVTNELITTYLDSYSAKALKGEAEGGVEEIGSIPISFRVKREDCDSVLEAVVKTDTEDWNQNGPYTDIRRAWEERLDGLPRGYQSRGVRKQKQKVMVQNRKDNLFMR